MQRSTRIDALVDHPRLLIGLVAATFAASCTATQDYAVQKRPFNVYVADAEIVFRGTITVEAYEHLLDLLKELERNPERLTITSGGGDADVGIDLGFLVHRLGLDVYVPTYCGSSCANYVFTAGKQKVLSETAFLMWHGGATQQGVGDPPPCVEGGWYEGYLDCDPDEFSRKFDPILEEWLEKEARFFATVGVDQRITVLGQDPALRSSKEQIGGWYYSLRDMERLGVMNVQVQGGNWNPVPPTDKVKFCRVDLQKLPE